MNQFEDIVAWLQNNGLDNNDTVKHNSLTLAYDLIAGRLLYRILESAHLIPQDDYKRFYNPNGIKFPVEFTIKMIRAQLESVKEYLSKNGTRDMYYWLDDRLKESKQYQALKQYYFHILLQQLKDIQYKKWKAMDRYLSFMSFRKSL